MKHRTEDKAFFPCPICGKRPYVTYYLPNCGWAECNGTLFHRHDKLLTIVGFERPSKLISKLAHEWNQGNFIKE